MKSREIMKSRDSLIKVFYQLMRARSFS